MARKRKHKKSATDKRSEAENESEAIKTATTKISPFLTLPLEIRHMIYDILFAPTTPTAKMSHGFMGHRFRFMCTCRQIHQETIPIFYSISHFDLRFFDPCSKLPATIQHLCSFVREVTVRLQRDSLCGNQPLIFLKRLANLKIINIAPFNRSLATVPRWVSWLILLDVKGVENMTVRFAAAHQQALWNQKMKDRAFVEELVRQGQSEEGSQELLVQWVASDNVA